MRRATVRRAMSLLSIQGPGAFRARGLNRDHYETLTACHKRLHVVGIGGDDDCVAIEGATNDVGVCDVGSIAVSETLADLLGPIFIQGIGLNVGEHSRQKS
jgi:hypothetical protein